MFELSKTVGGRRTKNEEVRQMQKGKLLQPCMPKIGMEGSQEELQKIQRVSTWYFASKTNDKQTIESHTSNWP